MYCSNLEISAIKSQNGVVENDVFRPKNFGEKDPQNQMWTFYAHKGTHQVETFGAIPSTFNDRATESGSLAVDAPFQFVDVGDLV